MVARSGQGLVSQTLSIPALRSWVGRKLSSGKPADEFDAVFYLRRYPDLATIDSVKAARSHFRLHGSAEGRFPNAKRQEEADYGRYAIRSATFDLTAYRELNPDLRAVLTTDRDYILHYIRHGRAEGRRAIADDEASNPGARSWEGLLNVSQYSAWIAGREQVTFASRAIAIDHFRTTGIEWQAPLCFDMQFEPDFYRAIYLPRSRADEVTLYRSWLMEGLDANRAPNEVRFLYPYLCGAAFPEAFDWQAYRTARMRRGLRTARSAVLAHMFENERDWSRAGPFLNGATDLIEAIAAYRLRHGKAGEAAAVLALKDDQASATPSALRLAGRVAAARGQSGLARDAFEQALKMEHRVFDTLDMAVKANLGLGAFDQVFALLRRHRTAWAGDPRFEALGRRSIDTIHERCCAQAHAALTAEPDPDRDFVTEWSGRFQERLGTIAAAIEAVELAPARLGPQPSGPVLLLGNEDIRQCRHYRIEQKQEQFAAAGIALSRHKLDDADAFISGLIGARAAIFYRVPATPAVMRAILTARGLGIPTYYDIDDLLFDPRSYPDDMASYGGQLAMKEYRGLQYGVPMFAAAVALCDRAIASTKVLLDQMTPLVREKRGLLLANGLDSRNEDFLALDQGQGRQADTVRIFYGSGTLAQTGDFSELCVPALVRILARHEQVDLVLVGHVAHDAALQPYVNRIYRFPVLDSLNAYWALLSACDINLAVLAPGVANDCKSEIKWLEAAMFAIPTVASASATMRAAISDGVDGLLAINGEAWYDCLADLIRDPAQRREIGQMARQRALADYSLPVAAQVVAAEFGAIAGAEQAVKQLRVLVVNVFFAPQSIGGATRVVENNVLHISQDCPDIALAVACTDEGQDVAYRLRTSQFGETPVFRIAAPRAATEMRAFDEDMAAPFRRILARFQPDVVHFHCVQRLTATVVRECRAAGIPYVVSLHDGWWLSSSQFLVDRDGVARLPQDDLWAEQGPGRKEDVLARRQLLRAQLAGARQVLTVSESFAKICRAAQGAPVAVIANGVPALQPLVPRPSSADVLRLAHIGGRASHKGADLIEAALRCGDYPKLSLLMIDGALQPGESRETIWGSSQVTLSAPWPQEQVADLYGRIDVLLAPSTWPESYGLVAREAEFYGLWVVASSGGAMGNDIREGRNGFLIDTGSRQALDDVLSRMNADPAAFRRGTAAPTNGQRHARDQASELASLYRAIADGGVGAADAIVAEAPAYSR